LALIILLNSCSQAAMTGQDPVKKGAVATDNSTINRSVKVYNGGTRGYIVYNYPNPTRPEQYGWDWEACAQTVMNYLDPTCHVTQTELHNNFFMVPTLSARICTALNNTKSFHGCCGAANIVIGGSQWGELNLDGLPGHDIASFIKMNLPIIIIRRYLAAKDVPCGMEREFPVILDYYNTNNRTVMCYDPRLGTWKTYLIHRLEMTVNLVGLIH
jgi:hypothetical protein